MPDREKVIKAIEICYTVGHNCTECPLFNEDDCNDRLMRDALALLREQEPANVTTRRIPANGGSIVWTCGKCGADLAPNNAKAKYCSACGKAVKWDG